MTATPDFPHTAADVDAIMAAEMNRMTIEERERTYEEVHGVDKGIEESEAMILKSVDEMRKEIEKISSKEAFEKAREQSPSYTEDTKFWLKFLRAEGFDPKKAARRIIDFFEGKLRYFGSEKLTKKIALSDLSPGALKVLKKGHMQFLTERDRAGRLVFVDLQAMDFPAFEQIHDVVTVFIYMLLCAAEDDENQRRGIVLMLYKVETPPGVPNPDPAVGKEGPRVLNWVPIRVVGAHMCLDDPVMKALAGVVLMSAGASFRARYRVHFGTYTETMYSLMSFGIPVDAFPIGSDASIKKAAHTKWMSRRSAKELAIEKGKPFNGVDLPSGRDVLIGKGKPIQLHKGNIYLRETVADFWDEYSSTKKGEKGLVVQKVFQLIKERSGRFLAKDKNGWWVEVSDMDAHEKVAKTFLSAGTKVNRGKSLKTQRSIGLKLLLDEDEGHSSRKKQRLHPVSNDCLCFGF